MRIKHKHMSSAALILLLVILMITLTFSTSQTLPKPRIYIALGDSVSAGLSVAADERHGEVFFEMLKNEGYVDEYDNGSEEDSTALL